MTHEQNRVIALNIFATQCFGRNDKFHKGNCVHCCLRGESRTDTADEKGLEPNYAGWARLYVQAGREIPACFANAFLNELERIDGPSYVKALKEDISYHGLTIIGSRK